MFDTTSMSISSKEDDMPGCVFCDIIHNDSQNQVEAVIGNSVVITPLGPVTPEHKLVIPRIHISDITVNPSITAGVMGAAAVYLQRMGWGACNVITSRGRAATQTVFHMHVHLIPRSVGDGLVLPWTEQNQKEN